MTLPLHHLLLSIPSHHQGCCIFFSISFAAPVFALALPLHRSFIYTDLALLSIFSLPIFPVPLLHNSYILPICPPFCFSPPSPSYQLFYRMHTRDIPVAPLGRQFWREQPGAQWFLLPLDKQHRRWYMQLYQATASTSATLTLPQTCSRGGWGSCSSKNWQPALAGVWQKAR